MANHLFDEIDKNIKIILESSLGFHGHHESWPIYHKFLANRLYAIKEAVIRSHQDSNTVLSDVCHFDQADASSSRKEEVCHA